MHTLHEVLFATSTLFSATLNTKKLEMFIATPEMGEQSGCPSPSVPEQSSKTAGFNAEDIAL